MNAIARLSHRTVARPMKTTFATSLGAKKAATSVLVHVTLADGAAGLGEVPTSFVIPHETPAAIAAVLDLARELLVGNCIDDYGQLLQRLRREHPTFHMTLASLEVALFRAALQCDAAVPAACGEAVSASCLAGILPAREKRIRANNVAPQKRQRNCKDAAGTAATHEGKMPSAHAGKMPASRRTHREWRHWGGRLRSIETDITIPFVPSGDELKLWLGRIVPGGFTTYKIKVSGKVERDVAFIQSAREILGAALPRFVIRLDGNQGYTALTYSRMIAALEKARIEIELFEQPLHKADLAGLRRIRGVGASPVILDETIFCADDCRRAIDRGLADGVNVKIAKSGLAEAAAIVTLARRAKWKLMIGCMTETMVGLSAGIRLAAGMGVFDYIDLDSIHFLHHRRQWQDIAIEGSRYRLKTVGRGP